MKFIIDQKIFEKFPDANIGVAVVCNIDNRRPNSQIAKLTRKEEERIRSMFHAEKLSQDTRIACWREAYRAFGIKPSEARSSVEALYKLVLRGVELRAINPLVDIYNYICLKYMLPVGGEDIDKMVGELRLTFAKDEKPVKLLGDAEAEAPRDGEVIYKDEEQTICRCWNWREAERTKLTADTQHAILVVEGLPPTDGQQVEYAINELAELIEKYCGGNINKYLLNKNCTEFNII